MTRSRGFTTERSDGTIYHQDRVRWDSAQLGTFRRAVTRSSVAGTGGTSAPATEPVRPVPAPTASGTGAGQIGAPARSTAVEPDAGHLPRVASGWVAGNHMDQREEAS